MTLTHWLKQFGMYRNGWRAWHIFAALGLVLLGMLLTGDAWRDMYRIWMRDEESSHAFLVPVVAVWLFWVRRGRLRHCRPVGTWVGPVIVTLGAILNRVGDRYLIQSFWHGGAVLVAIGCAMTFLGRQVLISFLPMFFALLFVVPVPQRVRQRVAVPLQTATARVTQHVLDLTGRDVERSGNLLRINNVDVAVAEACNGMRMTFALLLVSYTFAFTTPLRPYARLLIIVLSPISAILCNVIRLVPTVWVFGQFSSETAQRFHDISGWVMLFVGFMLLMGVINLLRWMLVPVSTLTLAYD